MTDRIGLRTLTSGLLATTLLASPVLAEAVLDGTTGSTGSFSGDFEIPAEVGRRAGANVFHSFERFHIRLGESATFTGPAGIDNVISRVTGDEASRINGVLRSTVPGADFWFLNPRGIVFGPNASLHLPGSLHVSTADELRFSDGSVFSATDPQASSFTIAAPEAFGFLASGPGAITVDGSELNLPAGEALSLVGGTVSLNAAVIAISGGEVDLVGAPVAGEVTFAGTMEGLGQQGGEVTLSGLSLLDTRGPSSGPVGIHGGAIAAHNAHIFAGGPLSIVGKDVFIHGGRIGTSSPGTDGEVAPITLLADRLDVRRGAFVSSSTDGAGAGGDLTISAGFATITENSAITSSTFGSGNAGEIVVTAREGIVLSDDSEVAAFTSGSGSGGRVTIMTPHLDITTGASIATATVLGKGHGGPVTILVDRLRLANGGFVQTGTAGAGDAGGLTVIARESVAISGADSRLAASTAQAMTDPFPVPRSSGAGGTIRIGAPLIRVSDGGAISARSLGTGPAGDVVAIASDRIELRGGAITTEAAAEGGGRIVIRAMNLFELRTGAITTSVVESGSTGDGGDISIDPRFVILDDSQIEATARRGNGGNVRIVADQFFTTPDSRIDASSELGIDGTVEVTAPDLDLTSELAVLPTAYIDVSGLLLESCAARASNRTSSFTASGAGGVAPDPAAPLAGRYAVGGSSPTPAAFRWALSGGDQCDD